MLDRMVSSPEKTQPGLNQFVLMMLAASQGRGNGIPSHWGVTHDPSEVEKNTDHCGGMYSSKLTTFLATLVALHLTPVSESVIGR